MIYVVLLSVFVSVISAADTRYHETYYYGYYGKLGTQAGSQQLTDIILTLLNRLPLSLYNNYICNVLVFVGYQSPYYYSYPYGYLYNRRRKHRQARVASTKNSFTAYQLIRYSQAVRGTVKTLYSFWNPEDLKTLYDDARKISTEIMAKERTSALTAAETTRRLIKYYLQRTKEKGQLNDVIDAVNKLNSKSKSSIYFFNRNMIQNSCRVIRSQFYCNYLSKMKRSSRCSNIYYSSQMLNQCCSTNSTSNSSVGTTIISNTGTTPASTATTTTSRTTTTPAIRACGISTINPASRVLDFMITLNQFRIVGGVDTEKCEYPWVVRLQAADFLCSGSIIDELHVMTAAHCVGGTIRPNGVTVIAGDHNYDAIETDEVRKRVTAITIHPNYTKRNDDTVDNDIAILTLSEPLVFNNCIQPICLPNAGDSSTLNNTQCTVAGWGTTSYEGSASPILQEITIPTYSGNKCSAVFQSSLPTNNSTQICAGRTGEDACQGDSGGPLFCPVDGKYVQYGLVSFGSGCGVAGSAGIYTDVSAMLSFINSVVSTTRAIQIVKNYLPFLLS